MYVLNMSILVMFYTCKWMIHFRIWDTAANKTLKYKLQKSTTDGKKQL